jgi:hypothetical protein
MGMGKMMSSRLIQIVTPDLNPDPGTLNEIRGSCNAIEDLNLLLYSL